MSNCRQSSVGPRLGPAATLTALLLALVLVALGCGSNEQGGPDTTVLPPITTAQGGTGTAEVTMTGFAYEPATLTIGVGETVTWVNEDTARHDVIADNGEFASDLFGQGESFSFTFQAAGTYPYHCGVHPGMTGTVIVQ